MFLSGLLMAVDREMSDQIIRMMSYELFLVDLHSMDLDYQYNIYISFNIFSSSEETKLTGPGAVTVRCPRLGPVVCSISLITQEIIG